MLVGNKNQRKQGSSKTEQKKKTTIKISYEMKGKEIKY